MLACILFSLSGRVRHSTNDVRSHFCSYVDMKFVLFFTGL